MTTPTGGMAKDKCETGCANLKYQKCNFEKNTCDDCTLGKDKNCQFTEAYCKAAQAAGHCKMPALDGLYR